MISNVDYSISKLHTLLSVKGGDKLLTVKEILQLQDGDIVFAQWPLEEGATPYIVKTKIMQGYDRPWIYATDIHPYREGGCYWDRELSGFGKYTPGNAPYHLRVWTRELPAVVEEEPGNEKEIYLTVEWS